MRNDLRNRILAERKSLDCDTRTKLNYAILENITNLNNFKNLWEYFYLLKYFL